MICSGRPSFPDPVAPLAFVSVYSDRSFALAGLEIGVQQDDMIRCIGNAAVGMAFVPAARFFPDHAFFGMTVVLPPDQCL